MEDYPSGLMEFESRFGTEEACLDYLERLRWPDGFRCPRCSCTGYWLTKRNLYHCKQCDLQTSLLAGTIFQGSRKLLQLWFRAIWHICSQKYGANALGLQRVLGLGSYQTAWVWLHKLRRAMVRPDRDRLSGVMEVDETYVGGKKSGKTGRGTQGKVLVVVVVQQTASGIGRIRLKRVADASGESLGGAVEATVEPGSIVYTDGWQAYGVLGARGYAHAVLRKEISVGDAMLPSVNRVVSLLKRWLLGTYQGAVAPSHIDYYLDEFTFRFNRRTSRSRGKLFHRLVQQAAAIDPLPAKDIRGKGSDQEHNI